VKALGAHVLDGSLPLPLAHEAFAATGQLSDARRRAHLDPLIWLLLAPEPRFWELAGTILGTVITPVSPSA